MGQRNSGYAREKNEHYQTPYWVTETLIPHLRMANVQLIWEPAAGKGTMVAALAGLTNKKILASDLNPQGLSMSKCDFLDMSWAEDEADIIVTNPPYKLGPQFCRVALERTRARGGQVAMLTRIDFDSAKTRRDIFADHPAFAKKIVLLHRIVWFVEANGKPKKGPSENHCWVLWDWRHVGPPQIHYEERSGKWK